MSKKEAENKKLKEARDQLHGDVEVLNENILKDSWVIDQ